MNNEAPEFITRCVCGIPSRTGLCEHLENVEPPVTIIDDLTMEIDPPAAPDERDKALEDRLWEALKEHSCKKPDEAKLIVFLSEKKFREAVGPLLATVCAEERESALTDVLTRIESLNPHLTFGSANGGMMKKCIIAEIESARTGKVEG